MSAGGPQPAAEDLDYVELVLQTVERIPPGRVMTYGDIAEYVGRGGARQVGAVLSRHGAGVPWWRVIRADGHPVGGLEDPALERLVAEDCPVSGDRVRLAAARWNPAGDDARPTTSD